MKYLVDTDWIIDHLTILTNNLKHFERVEGLKTFSIKE